MITLTLLHQKGALSYEKDHRSSIGSRSLSDRMPPDKHAKPSLFKTQDIELKDLNKTHEEVEVVLFDSYSANLYVDSLITGKLTGFRSDFIEVNYVDIEEQPSDVTTGKASIIDEGVVASTLIDDDGEYHTTHTNMAYAP